MPREPKAEHRPYLAKIRDKDEAEKRARARAEAQVAAAVAAARAETNEAIVEAVERGATKEAIRVVLGVSYTTVINRVAEHRGRAGLVTRTAEPVSDEETDGTPRVRVTKDDAGYTVTLDEFSHPDVGENVSGTVIYDLEGDLKIADQHLQNDDPLWADKLWATTEVQDRVEGA